ncbi:biotin-dependent carboxyltransferase family protein [Paenibacillus sp. WQ 127069]|uniref:Biotin-dependent carboxyltransferase family protein n=1 Tax=Paenibacillus baimaensis TaxID=2982185 RepID=A0ABT2UQF3_9BACL|nr:biotin-dependent carboxyltransferase family protein [Paenibacillus sp. WQ 127069]MCU6795894.1 biotin-dependent carboxyltransferase family protein [Paenibacillus sp. WQ 127069]
MEFIEIIKPGMFSTVQDLGRFDFRQYGIPQSGAMDAFSFRAANLLVGNRQNEAAVEFTLVGPKLKFLHEGVIAITGADLSFTLNGRPLALWKTIRVMPDDILQCGSARYGCRSYMAVSGGIDVPLVMGSSSTFARGGYGGFQGRSLRTGDVLAVKTAQRVYTASTLCRVLPSKYRPVCDGNRPVRFITGPQADSFTQESMDILTTQPYTLSHDSDRMGFRLMGPKLVHTSGADIISDYITMGSIQVPGDGQPIVLMSDCQVTGGYTKIGVVAGVDLPFLAQRKPGDQVFFEIINIEQAQALWREQEQLFSLLDINNR